MPDYIRENAVCNVIAGPLDQPGMLGPNTPPIAQLVPDYDILSTVGWQYKPEDSYFCRVSVGCIRHCRFCAVPTLEPDFGYLQGLSEQIGMVDEGFGQRQHLVLLDNNILALDNFPEVVAAIRDAGFGVGAKRNGRQRSVDFNQGIDVRLITRDVAKELATICLSPVRLAFDNDGVERPYRRAIKLLADAGFREFTNYMMFNFRDTPESFYRRLRVNTELSEKLDIKVTGFPMRYIPVRDIHRKHVADKWHWRYLRGIQCVLHATHGMVSPNPVFVDAAFGKSYEEFLEIVSMPDRYIIHRKKHEDAGAAEWRSLFRALSADERNEFLNLLPLLNASRNREAIIAKHPRYEGLLRHYYPSRQDEHQLRLPILGTPATGFPEATEEVSVFA